MNSDQLQIVARWKDSEKRIVPKENRARAVIIPSNLWDDECNHVKEKSVSLSLFVRDALEELAKSYLSEICESSGWQRREVNQDAFSVSSLLTWQAEQAATAGRLNGEAIKAWVAKSATVAKMTETHGEKIGVAFGELLVKLAGPNHGISPEKADKILSTMWDVKDGDDNTGLRVMLRLQAIRDKQPDANVLDSIF